MGKTKPTYRVALDGLQSDWKPYRKWLRKQKRPAYDEVWEHASGFADAAGEANPRNPMEGVLLSICHGQQVQINKLQERIEELEESQS